MTQQQTGTGKGHLPKGTVSHVSQEDKLRPPKPTNNGKKK